MMTGLAIVFATVAFAVPDAMRTPHLRDVRLEGWLGRKMDRFISQRLTDPFQRKEIFDEASGLNVPETNDRVRVVRLAGMGVARGCDRAQDVSQVSREGEGTCACFGNSPHDGSRKLEGDE